MRIVFSSWSLKMTSIIDQLSDGDYVMVPVGSRRTCNPPPTDTDDDYLVLCGDRNQTARSLRELGFEPPEDIEEYVALHDCNFISLRFGELNFIVTDDMLWFDKFLTASYFAKKYNVTNKEDRIELFSTVMRLDSKSVDYAPNWFKLAQKKLLTKTKNWEMSEFGLIHYRKLPF
jgi:hypothetical protein